MLCIKYFLCDLIRNYRTITVNTLIFSSVPRKCIEKLNKSIVIWCWHQHVNHSFVRINHVWTEWKLFLFQQMLFCEIKWNSLWKNEINRSNLLWKVEKASLEHSKKQKSLSSLSADWCKLDSFANKNNQNPFSVRLMAYVVCAIEICVSLSTNQSKRSGKKTYEETLSRG